MLTKFLHYKGCEAITATTPQEGIEKVKTEMPKVGLLDIRMPGMDGVEALRKIKEIDTNVGVIMITAVKEADVAKECIKLGAFDYITKPLSLDYLEQVLSYKFFQIETGGSCKEK